MAKNDDRKRKIEAGGKSLSIVLTKEADEALAELQNLLKRRGEPDSREAVVCRALIWAVTATKKGKEPPATQQLTRTHETPREPATTQETQAPSMPHEQAHEQAHESSESHGERITALEERIEALEAALLHGVQPGQWGGI